MSWSTIFANLPTGNQPLALFDAMFAQIASLAAIPCTAAGANAVQLTGFGNAPTLATYQRYTMFRFRPVAVSTGPVTISYQTLGFLPAYKADGLTQVGANDLQPGIDCLAVVDTTLNGGFGGFFVESAGLPTAAAQAVVTEAEAGGRLSLQAATPWMTASQTGKNTHVYTPDKHAHVPINISGTMVMTDVLSAGDLTQLTTDASKSPAAVAASSVYFVYVWNDAGVYRCTRGPAWTNDTTPGAANALSRVQGVYTNALAITNGPGVQLGTLVGALRSDATSLLNWKYGSVAAGGGEAIFGVDNVYNRRPVTTVVQDSTDSWPWNIAAYRAANGSATNRVSYVQALEGEAVRALYHVMAQAPAAGNALAAIGYDSTTALATGCAPATCQNSTTFTIVRSELARLAEAGYHFISAIEADLTAGTSTFIGDGGNPAAFQNGLFFQCRF